MNVDPVTNKPIPPDAIQRILYITPKLHIYAIPPITSNKGFNAASWTTDPKSQIFTARLRIIETAIPKKGGPDAGEDVSVTILLEDPSTGALFAAAPYTHPSTVEQASDSSRFFAVRVVGDGGRKATLGRGFEERPEAFDFGVALQDARRTLHMDGPPTGVGAAAGARGAGGKKMQEKEEVKRDLSLKQGEMITISIGGKGRRTLADKSEASSSGGNPFALPPPPSHGKSANSLAFLPPPPSTADAKAELAQTKGKDNNTRLSAADLGFDDGEFGEFQ
jgi:hypothetical protein